MPKASVPAVVAKPSVKLVLNDDHKVGYSFFNDQWEGEESHKTAWAVSLYWQQKGWVSNLHEGEINRWVGGKNTQVPYFKVWIRHPKYHNLYAWWAPTDAEWTDDPRMDELTWFEFVKKEDKK